ncbi:MAG: 3-deoxy-manno-octulosonate cytidylyltransferase [Gammaproteobacteria bacterium]|nr:3-deoxy-manno-octulosonate cytidylyltransferase [Gammaproteobacteria bacterium]MYH14186.1 3-deoxy-manno-octulosonate cytidylyltransferase [Gammaproteobacteria bacterium]MYK82669.1 3-deoxy-manno-octulosonate cytidylyltransferase [Gammaproteobacteria bacterium]
MSAFRVVIPARYGSTRLPGKPLLRIGGTAMVVRVAEQARLAGADEVIVATDDERVAEVVAAGGFAAVMTDPNHGSGTDRVWEVARQRAGWEEDAIVINVQGDEPLIEPEIIAQLAAAVSQAGDAGVATLCEPIASHDDLLDPNLVKVVRDTANFALYFSRSPIPHARDGYPAATAGLWRRHIGIYGYRVRALRRFVSLPPSALEGAERLEQLRALEHGMPILVLDACRPSPGGVDTPADLERVRQLVEGATSAPS